MAYSTAYLLGPGDPPRTMTGSPAELRYSHFFGRRHPSVESLGDLVRLKPLKGQDGEPTAASGRPRCLVN